MRSLVIASSLALLALACSAPTDERAPTDDGQTAPPRCESCHVADYEAVEDPPHAQLLPPTCFVCHSQTSWSPARLEHDYFELTGAHLSARCIDCHIKLPDGNAPRFGGTPSECVGCHRDDYDQSPFPGHSHFPLTCEQCHSTSAWSPTLHPPPDAWVAPPDAGTEHHHHHDAATLDAGTSAIEPPPHPNHVDAGTHRRRPPPTTTRPPPTTTTEPPPDVHTRASQRR